MNNRVNQLGVAQPQIQTEGTNLIDVQLPDEKNVEQAEKTVGNTAQLFFYDWEGNVLTPTGQLAANGLQTADPASIALSQGNAQTIFPGTDSSTAGAMGFYIAVQLAAKQPFVSDTGQQQGSGNQFLLFGSPDSAACTALATATKTKLIKGVHCLIAGPIDLAASKDSSRAAALKQLRTGLSKAEIAGTQMIEVKQGTQVLQASPASFTNWPKYGSPNAGYYVIRDNVALFGKDNLEPRSEHRPEWRPRCHLRLQGPGRNALSRHHSKTRSARRT